MLFSSSVDDWAARWLAGLPAEKKRGRQFLLAISLTTNLAPLGFFSISASSVKSPTTVRFAGGGPLPVFAMILPVGISFYTFEGN